MIDWNRLHVHLPRVRSEDLQFQEIEFPAMPESILLFSHLTQNPDASLADVAEPLERDPAYALELMRYVNAATMGNRRPVTTIPQALSLIGIQRARTMVLCSALQKSAGGLVDHEQFRRQQEEAVERAMFAAQLATRLGGDAALSYVGGLLQDLMLPVLMARFPDFYQTSSRGAGSLATREQDEFGWTHADIMAEVLRKWHFPDEIIFAIAFHHRSDVLLNEPEHRCPLLVSAVLSASVSSEFDPRPLGNVAYTDLQVLTPDLSLLEVAVGVDEAIEQGGLSWPGRVNLCQRLGDQFHEQLNSRRLAQITERLRLGSYTLETKLGEGGMGSVFLARHNRLRRPAAIKMFSRPDCSPELIARFEAEVQFMSMLRSPHVIHVYDYGITRDGLLYYVMEFVPGVTLKDYVVERGLLSQSSAIHILEQICLALLETHQAKLLHGDISLRNIMITEVAGDERFVKLLDYGFASIIGSSNSQSDTIYGTPLFVAPEILQNPRNRDVRSEIYAIGAVAYYMLTGQPVFQATTVAHIMQQTLTCTPIPPSTYRPAPMSAALEQIVMRCLTKQPDARPQSVDILLQELKDCRVGLLTEHDDLKLLSSRCLAVTNPHEVTRAFAT